MGRFDKIMEKFNTKKTAKKHGRTYEQQQYRNDLAKNLKETRKLGDIGQDLSKSYLEKEKYTRQYFESLGNDRKLGMDIAMELINSGEGELVVEYLDKFKGVDYDMVAKKFIESDKVVFLDFVLKIVSNLDKFEGIDNNELARKLVDMDREGEYQKYCGKNRRWNGGKYLLCKNLDKFNGLDYDILKSLVNTHIYSDFYKRWEYEVVGLDFIVPNLDKFKGVDYNELARLLTHKREYKLLYNNIDKFEGLDQEIVKDLFIGIVYDDYRLILNDIDNGILDKFHKLGGLNYSYMLRLIIEEIRIGVADWFSNYEDGWSSKIINKMILKSEGLLDISVAKGLITPNHLNGRDYSIYEDYGSIVVKNINKFESSAHPEMASAIIDKGSKNTVSLFLKNIKNFEGLDYNEIAKKLVAAGYGDFLAKNSEKFRFKKEK